jgi:hypothetical protein
MIIAGIECSPCTSTKCSVMKQEVADWLMMRGLHVCLGAWTIHKLSDSVVWIGFFGRCFIGRNLSNKLYYYVQIRVECWRVWYILKIFTCVFCTSTPVVQKLRECMFKNTMRFQELEQWYSRTKSNDYLGMISGLSDAHIQWLRFEHGSSCNPLHSRQQSHVTNVDPIFNNLLRTLLFNLRTCWQH